MKKSLTALMILSMLAAPVTAQSLDNQAFEVQVFHSETAQLMQLSELSAQEMKETEGVCFALNRVYTSWLKPSNISRWSRSI